MTKLITAKLAFIIVNDTTNNIISLIFTIYTQVTSICMLQLELKALLDKALIEVNGCSIVEINNDV